MIGPLKRYLARMGNSHAPLVVSVMVEVVVMPLMVEVEPIAEVAVENVDFDA